MKNYQKNFVGLFVLFFLILVIGVWPGSAKRDQEVFEAILDGFLSGEKEELFLKNIFDYEWDKVCLFPPYSINTKWKKYFGEEIAVPSVGTDDGFGNLVFVLDDKAFHHFYYRSVGGGSFSCSNLFLIKKGKIYTC